MSGVAYDHGCLRLGRCAPGVSGARRGEAWPDADDGARGGAGHGYRARD